MPERIQLRRAKGWRMPANTVKVDRTTSWGNPFIVGEQGTAIECVYWFVVMLGGFQCVSLGSACADRQLAFGRQLRAEKDAGFPRLRGKNLACWCKPGHPCHADVLLDVVNTPPGRPIRGNLKAILARYGYRAVNGRMLRLS